MTFVQKLTLLFGVVRGDQASKQNKAYYVLLLRTLVYILSFTHQSNMTGQATLTTGLYVIKKVPSDTKRQTTNDMWRMV